MASSTACTRGSSSSAAGTSKRMPLALILAFARTRRLAIAWGATRKALAIRAASMPSTVCNISALREAASMAGWVQTKSRRSRSSGIGACSGAMSPSVGHRTVSVGSSARRCRRAAIKSWRLAAVINQPSGEAGMPSAGQRDKALAKASPMASSAAAMSRHCQASQATMRPYELRAAATAAAWASAPRLDRGADASITPWRPSP